MQIKPIANSDELQPLTALSLARASGAPGQRATLAWQFLRTICRLGFAASMAIFAGEMIENGILTPLALAGALAGLLLSAVAGLLAELQAARAETKLVSKLRNELDTALAGMSAARIHTRSVGALIAGLARHPPALAGLVIGHAAARNMLAIAPLAAATAIAFVSWQAALTLLLAIPVMIVCFILLGSVVRIRAEAQESAFGRLAAQFSDRIRSLPTVLANHALAREHGKIERRMTDYADSTMSVLSKAFLNAGIIDFFSALAIAVLAVFLGLGHLGLVHIPGFTGLQLWQSLFILIVAADFFTPFRRYAEQYHVKAEGEAAAKKLDWYFESAATKTMPARFVPAGIENFDIGHLPRSGMVAISGPSGAGKSTMLRVLAGIEAPLQSLAALPTVAADSCDWISTDIYVPAGTLADAIAWNRSDIDRAAVVRAATRVGLLDESLLPGGLDAPIGEGGDNLSGGQRMRIGVARALLSDRIVFADEPTAKLDSVTAALVHEVLADIARLRLVVVATHDRRLIQMADRELRLHLRSPDCEAVAA